MIIRFLLGLTLILWSCTSDIPEVNSTGSAEGDSSVFAADTLHVATRYGSSSYFTFRGEVIGYDVELSQNFAAYLGKPVRYHLAKTNQQLYDWLEEGKVDLVAYDVYQSRKLKERFRFVALQPESYLVLVQMIGVNTVTAIPELKGKTIHVTDNSPQLKRLRNLNRELGGTINIVVVPDTVSSDDLIDQVLKRKIEYTVAYYNKAIQYKEHNRRMDCRLQLGFSQRNGWLIAQHRTELEQALATWEELPQTELFRSQLYSKYILRNPYFTSSRLSIPRGAISPFDHLFKKYAAEIGWDWRLLAAIAFHESGFDSSQISRRGASGLMQLMPRTAANFGLSRANITNPEKNIEAGVQYIKSLNLLYRKVEDPDERKKFILASYNSGPAHILDAMELARKHGKNPYVWHEHVEVYLEKKSDPEYYKDEVVKYGRFRAAETIRYVRNTLSTYQKFKGE